MPILSLRMLSVTLHESVRRAESRRSSHAQEFRHRNDRDAPLSEAKHSQPPPIPSPIGSAEAAGGRSCGAQAALAVRPSGPRKPVVGRDRGVQDDPASTRRVRVGGRRSPSCAGAGTGVRIEGHCAGGDRERVADVLAHTPGSELSAAIASDLAAHRVQRGRRQAEANSKRIVRMLRADGISAAPYIAEGNPGLTIVETAAREECDAIVMATHGRSGLRRVLIGSGADYVVRHSPCPVFLCRPRADSA
jgi:nucleotide-binding universal stress UspA family protein